VTSYHYGQPASLKVIPNHGLACRFQEAKSRFYDSHLKFSFSDDLDISASERFEGPAFNVSLMSCWNSVKSPRSLRTGMEQQVLGFPDGDNPPVVLARLFIS
jgi:hypothetical protein